MFVILVKIPSLPMNTSRMRVGILFGGKSAEHEISILSAANVLEALDRQRWEPLLIYIDPSGKWHLLDERNSLHDFSFEAWKAGRYSSVEACLLPGGAGRMALNGQFSKEEVLDLVFPILHGPLGEDGTVQGLLRIAELPFVGPGVLGSAVGMDKEVMKRLLKEAGVPIGPYLTFRRWEAAPVFTEVAGELGMPVFVKPANLGSSVGISRADSETSFRQAVELAFSFDDKIVVEAQITGREIECAVLGNESVATASPGEIIPSHRFYSYEAKYLDPQGARTQIPANIDPDTEQRLRQLAVQTYQALCCEGLSRVDFFLTDDGRVLVNEINTLPGFTRISMYPKMWEQSGLGYPELVSRLLDLAIERHQRDARLQTQRTPNRSGESG
jgi:D-alanine-D-alanine ligase